MVIHESSRCVTEDATLSPFVCLWRQRLAGPIVLCSLQLVGCSQSVCCVVVPVTPLADYYIIAGVVYQGPDLASIVNSRVVSVSVTILVLAMSLIVSAQ